MITYRKDRMKKGNRVLKTIRRTIILLLILAALGAAFYFGFYRFQLKAGNYGVVFTKINGWDPKVVSPASYRFEWEGLLPTNLSMSVFGIEERRTELRAAGELPSASAYAYYLEGDADFSYDIRFNLSYSLKPETLPRLAEHDFLTPDNLEGWLRATEDALILDAVNFINRKTTDESYMEKIGYNYRLMEEDLLKSLETDYPDISIASFVPTKVSVPDIELYKEGKRLYYDMLEFNREVKRAAMERAAERMVEESAKIELLEKYGAVFSKYPELIKYFGIYKEEGAGLIEPIELPDLSR